MGERGKGRGERGEGYFYVSVKKLSPSFKNVPRECV